MKNLLKTTLLVFLIIYNSSIHAATFTVTTVNISGPGSLPAAIAQANVTSGKNTINVSVNGAISLGSALPAITNNVTIVGTASSPTIISGGGALPLFSFAAGTTNSISNLVLCDAYLMNSIGSAISNAGTLFLNNCVLTNNIINGGQYTLNGVIYYPLTGAGGAVFNSGSMTISSTVISGNQSGIGGAVYNSGTMTLNNSKLFSNQGTNGGAIYNGGTLSVDSLTLSNNVATAGLGGGIYSTGVLIVSKSTFVTNSAVGLPSTPSNNGGDSYGGGLYIYSGTAGITNTTFFQNAVISGLATNVNYQGLSGFPYGGALYVNSGNCQLFNCSIVSNYSIHGSERNHNGISYLEGGGGIYNGYGSVSIFNTVISGNVHPFSFYYPTNFCPDLYGTFISSGNNLVGNNQGASGLSILDFQNVPANLGPLQENGGLTLTCAPLFGSYAIGYGTSSGAPTIDQRGVPRPKSGACDIGAVQTVVNSPLLMNSTLIRGTGFALDSIFDSATKYRIQASTNLIVWVDLYTNANGGFLHLMDTSANNYSGRYYRAIKP